MRASQLAAISCFAAVLLWTTPAAATTSMLDESVVITDPVPVAGGPTVTPSWLHLAFSPGGEHVYGAHLGLHVYDRDPVSGDLAFVQFLPSPDTRIAMSPDGAHLYGTDPVADEVNVYARDAGTGALTLVSTTPALVDPEGLFLSPDGAHLYVPDGANGSIFARDAGTGALTHVGTYSAAEAQAAFSSDGIHLYSTQNLSLVHVHERDPGTGALTSLGNISAPALRDVVISPDDGHVYALRWPGGVDVFSRDPGTGLLTAVETESFPIDVGLWKLAMSPDGGQLYASLGDRETIVVLDRDAGTGELTFLEEYDTHTRDSWIFVAPDGAHVYQTIPLFAHARDPGTGLLTFAGGLTSIENALDAVVSPDGAHAYLTFGRGWIVATERDVATGNLAPVQTVFDHLDASGLGYVHDLAISTDGAHVYSTGASVGAFSRDAGTGELTFVNSAGGGGLTVEISPDGTHVYSGSTVLLRDAGTGAVSVAGTGPSINPTVSICPDGAHAYVGADWPYPDGFGVLAYEIDAPTGALTLIDNYDGTGPAVSYAGMVAAEHVICSPDGAHVYALGEPLGLVVFARDLATGALTPIQSIEPGDEGVFSLSTESLEVSADGRYVYTAFPLNVLRRDLDTGLLGIVQIVDVEEPASSSAPQRVVASPDGEHVYVVAVNGVAAVAYTPGFQCTETPMIGCRTGDIAKVTVLDNLLDFKDKVLFRLIRGDATDASDFDPGTDNHFALCAYDESGPPELAFSAIAPVGEDCRPTANAKPKPCWTAGTTTKMNDRFATPDGLRKLTLKSGVDDKVKIIAKAQGDRVRPPELPLGLPLRIQLQSAAGVCWEAVFTTATKNDSSRFKAKVAN